MKNFKATLMACAALTVLAFPATANDMINNQAFGFVDGDIIQDTPGFDNNLTVEVGSISAKDGAQNNQARGDVNGQILQLTPPYGGPGSSNITLTAKVGSIKARAAQNNRAEGYVNGDITQLALDGDTVAEALVGTIDAGKGVAYYNYAEGFVNGEIRQTVGFNSKARVRVGSISK